jgi:hypothetical protein
MDRAWTTHADESLPSREGDFAQAVACEIRTIRRVSEASEAVDSPTNRDPIQSRSPFGSCEQRSVYRRRRVRSLNRSISGYGTRSQSG